MIQEFNNAGNYEWYGDFSTDTKFKNKVSGIFTHSSNLLKLELNWKCYNNTTFFPYIYAYLINKETGLPIKATFVNVRVINNSLYPQYAFLNELLFLTDKNIQKSHSFTLSSNINILKEFFWTNVSNIDKEYKFDINKCIITINGSVKGNPLYGVHNISEIFVAKEPYATKIKDFFISLSRELAENNSNSSVFIADKDSYNSFLRLAFKHKRALRVDNIDILRTETWKFVQLLMVLSNENNINIERETLDVISTQGNLVKFVLLSGFQYTNNKSHYSAFFGLNSKSIQNLESCIKTFYARYSEFEFILESLWNHKRDTSFSHNKITTIIDMMAHIACKKGFPNNTKYQDLIKDWCQYKYMEDYIRKLAKPFVKLYNKNTKMSNLGTDISNVRALFIHFDKLSFEALKYSNLIKLYYIFELICLDYLLQEIGVDKKICANYRNRNLLQIDDGSLRKHFLRKRK